MLEVQLLGRFSVTCDGRPLAIPARPAQLLLAYLLLNSGAPLPREALADTLWPDSSAGNARANLRHALWQLRAALGDANDPQTAYIVHTAHDIAFNRRSAYRLDVDTLAHERPAWTTAALLEAAAAYDGELLPGFYESWIVPERERLAVLFNRRASQLLERLMAEGRWDETVAWAERWIALDGAPEPAYRALMHTYAALGDAGQVMVAFRRCHEALREQLGIQPSPETRQLAERLTRAVGQGVAAGAPRDAGHHLPRAGPTPPEPRLAAAAAPGDDRQRLAAALAQAEIERQRANWYRLALSLLGSVTAALAAALAARRKRG